MIIISGMPGSGKSSVLRELEKQHGFKREITYTTRPPRAGETDGIGHRFITEELFHRLQNIGFFLDTTKISFDTEEGTSWYYGSALKELLSEAIAIPMDVNGVRNAKQKMPAGSVFAVLIKVSDDLLEKRLRARGDTEKQIALRLDHDKKIYDANVGSLFDFIIRIEETDGIAEIANQIFAAYKRYLAQTDKHLIATICFVLLDTGFIVFPHIMNTMI